MPSSPEHGAKPDAENVAREALKFVLSPQGSFFRDFLMTEIVQSIDALSRKQVKCLHFSVYCASMETEPTILVAISCTTHTSCMNIFCG